MRRSRASALILALAVLALLTVLATVYLASARLERRSSSASDESLNLDLARDAVFSLVQERLHDDTLGGYTDIPLYIPRPWMPSDPAGKGPMTYEKFNAADFQHATGLARRSALEREIVMGPDFRLYYCKDFHIADLLTHGPPPGNTLDWAPLTADLATTVGTPASRWYDYPERPLPDRWLDYGFSVDAANNLAGTVDEPLLVKHTVYPNIGSTDLSFLTSARFNPATGMFDLPYNRSPQFVPSTGDTSVNESLDANWNLLPFSSAAGAHYRFALRVIDTNGRANLNTGFVGSTYATMDADGRCTTSVPLDNPALFDGDDPAALHAARRGGIPDREKYTAFEWQERIDHFFSDGYSSNESTPNVPVAYNEPLAQFFDISDELELRAFEGRGTGWICRPEFAWPKTLAPNANAHQNRDNYTAYSFDRQVVPTFHPRFSIYWLGARPPWNVDIAHYGGRDPIDLRGPIFEADIIDVFTEFADALSYAGYSDDESLSFALNYLYQETGLPDLAIIRSGSRVYLKIWDDRPISDGTFWTPEAFPPPPGLPAPDSATPPSLVYLPYVAQPFLNEVDVILQPPQNQDDPPIALDFAVELINPYTVPLHLKGWRIRVGNDAWCMLGTRDLPDTIPAATDAAHPGFLTINLSRKGSGFRTLDPQIHTVENKTLDPVGQPVFLERPYRDITRQTQYLPVDQFPWPSPPPTLAPGGNTVTLSFQRNNLTKIATPTQPRVGAPDAWLAACPVYTATLAYPSLDATNPVPIGDSRLYGPYLPDRNADTFNLVAQLGVVPFCNRNIGQLEYISRLTPRLTAGGPVTVPDQLADPDTLFAPGGRSYFPQEAKVRFDYLADPRALEFLRLVATFQTSRTPGRINVNTASAPVLAAVFSNIVPDRTLAADLAAVIIAYRDRTRCSQIDDARYRPRNVDFDFSDPHIFPGRGVRSIAELAIPLGIATGGLVIDRSVLPPQIAPAPGQTLLTLHGTPYVRYRSYYAMNALPDAFFVPPPGMPIYDYPAGVSRLHPGALWPRLFTQLTVRSDTFVVEGVLEALRVHPNVSADPQQKIHHDNAWNWYDFDEGGNSMPGDKATVDDPTLTLKDDSYLRNLRIARRRFIGLIDRSYTETAPEVNETAYTPFTLPHIVAVEDLPQ
ncbi:MAG TPA: type II secretion system protein GspK [Phycisphaerae bacterium]|nr:type II secretion system protein GspK [Phycisphaerae bacterium]